MDTQILIFNHIAEKLREIESLNGAWNKFMGDYFARLIKYYLNREISNNYKIVLNAYISKFPIEYDMLIVDNNAKAEPFTKSFAANKVYLGLELKLSGIFGKGDEPYLKIKNNFDIAKKVHNHINFIYLAFQEVTKPVKKSSIDYLANTKKYLDPYNVYCLSNSRTKSPIPGEWEKFIKEIRRSLN